MKGPLIFTLFAGVAALAISLRPATAEAQAPGAELTDQCASCHALTKPADTSLEHLWERKGPDLWYAGDKFNREWLVDWLQNPTTVRPGGVMWFKVTKTGDSGDAIDTAALPAHPKVDAATAEKLADQLLALKSDGLVPEGAYDPAAVNMTMGRMGFTKLRGCIACHENAEGSGGLSGPQLHDAGKRLRPDYVISYMKDPQQFDPHVWMPTLTLNEQDLQRITGYVVSLGKESK